MALAGKNAVASKAPVVPVIGVHRFNTDPGSDKELAGAIQAQCGI